MNFKKLLIIFLISMVPIVELRGSIPLGATSFANTPALDFLPNAFHTRLIFRRYTFLFLYSFNIPLIVDLVHFGSCQCTALLGVRLGDAVGKPFLINLKGKVSKLVIVC